jgi:long-chain acyl-CoA synthetase
VNCVEENLMPADTIPARFLSQAKVRPDAPAYYTRIDGPWQMTSWRRRVERVQRIARALIALGVPEGGATSILGSNRAERVDWHLATMMIGARPAGIYTTCSPEQVRYIVEHSESPLLLLDSEEQLRKVEREWSKIPCLARVVLMPSAPQSLADGARVLAWDRFLDYADTIDHEKLDRRLAALSEEAAATVIYTSGTTGPPKAVLLSHKNLTFTADAAIRLVSLSASDRLFSYLPLSHIAEQMFSVIGPACAGNAVYFMRSQETVPDDLVEVQPTVFFGVPRVWEKMAAAVGGRIAELRGPKARAFAWASSVARRAVDHRNAGTPLGPRLSVEYALARKLVLGPEDGIRIGARLRDRRGPDAARGPRFLRGPRPAAPRGVRPVGSIRPHHLQRARPNALWHRGQSHPRGRSAHRRRRRNPGAREQRFHRLRQRSCRDERKLRRRVASLR